MLTTNNITGIVRKRILEATTDIVDDVTLLIYVNLTYQDIQKKIFPNDQITSATVSFISGVGTLPATFGTLYGSPVNTATNSFPELSIADFSNGTQTQGVTIEGGAIKVLPTSTTSLNIKFYPKFPTLTSSVNPTINEYFHECIIDGASFRCLFDLQDPELAAFYKTKYDNDLREKMGVLSNFEETNQNSGEMFIGQNLIGGSSYTI